MRSREGSLPLAGNQVQFDNIGKEERCIMTPASLYVWLGDSVEFVSWLLNFPPTG